MSDFNEKLPEATIAGDLRIKKIQVLDGGEIIFDGGLEVDHKIINQDIDIPEVFVPHGASIRFTGNIICAEYIGGKSSTTPVKKE